MSEYDELYKIAERQRVYEYKPDEAIANYKEALEIGGLRDRHIMQMIGVCHQMEHNYGQAMFWYERALSLEGTTEQEKGNLLRDMGYALGAMGRGAEALDAYGESMRLLREFPPDYAATVGFIGRQHLRDGYVELAFHWLSLADLRLHAAGNRELELYNKLWLAYGCSRYHRWFRARETALHSFWLSWQHGAWKHRVRALTLFFGGWRLDDRLREKSHK